MCIARLFFRREKPFDAEKSMAKTDLNWDRADILADGSIGPIHHMSAKRRRNEDCDPGP